MPPFGVTKILSINLLNDKTLTFILGAPLIQKKYANNFPLYNLPMPIFLTKPKLIQGGALS